MTAEIAVMNKQGIALAADSAATLMTDAGPKILTADKIFGLSKYQPVGIMVYGDAEFLGVPWDVVIKDYRQRLGDKSFDRVEDYLVDLCTFIADNDELFPVEQQDEYFRRTVYSIFLGLKERHERLVRQTVLSKGAISEVQNSRLLAQVINEQVRSMRSAEPLEGAGSSRKATIRSKFSNDIDEILDHVFVGLPLSNSARKNLNEIAVFLAVKTPLEGTAGIVIAGFGNESIFPELEAVQLVGLFDGVLVKSPCESLHVTHKTAARVAPFAQDEMVRTFMEGVDPIYEMMIERSFAGIFEKYASVISGHVGLTNAKKKKFLAEVKSIGDDLAEETIQQLYGYRNNSYAQPVMSVVAALPKAELAEMAESLVNLTSFKRRVSAETETVGEPIDVCVISKHDGLVWIKRKHYFEASSNPHFFANYYR